MPLPAPGRRDLNFLAPAEVDLVTVRRLESLAQTLGEIGAYALNAVEMYVKYQAKSIEGIGVASHCRKVR